MKKVFGILLAAVLLCTALAGCGGTTSSTAAPVASGSAGTSEPAGSAPVAGEKHKIGILAPAVTHGWVAAVAYNAEEQCKALADKVEYQLYTSNDANEMTNQLDDLLTWGAEAIVAFPQWEGMEVPIQRAIEQGVHVVNFDIEIKVDGVYLVTGDNEDIGVQGANYIVDKIGTTGTTVILDVPTSGSVAQLRKKGFEETMAEIAPDMELLTYATQFTREDGLTDFADILTSNAQIDAVYSMDDETSIGVLQAIREAGRTDIKVITGAGGAQEYFKMMPENEEIWIESAQYSPSMVRDAVNTALALLNGEEVEKTQILATTVVDRTNYQDFLDENSPY